MIEWVLLLISVYLVGIAYNKKFINQKVCAICWITILVVFQGLRSINVGIDLKNYQSFYYQCADMPFITIIKNPKAYLNIERGYLLFSKIIGEITNYNWQAFLVVIAVLNSCVLVLFVIKNSEDVLPAMIILIAMGNFVFSLSGIRQAIAIDLCLIAYNYLKKKKYVGYICFVVLAITFHKSAIVFFVTLICKVSSINDIKVFIMAVFDLFIMVFAANVMRFLLSKTLPSYLIYINEDSKFGFFGLFLLITTMCVYFIFKNKKELNKYSMIINILLFATLFQCFGNVSQLTGRIVLYFMPFFAVAFGNVKTYHIKMIATASTKELVFNSNFIVWAYAVFVLVFVLFMDLSKGYLNVVPYEFYWEGV